VRVVLARHGRFMLQFLASQLFRQAFLLLLGLIQQPFRLFLLFLGRHGGGRRHDRRLCRLRICPPPGG
jgi:hypothetical protein